jgi:DNA repair exonuclease SbcCD ATPase subunit
MEEVNWEWTDINLIKIDGDNPNRMSKQERDALRNNLTKYGWNMPIITDMNLLIADGEQKLAVAREIGLTRVPVLKKELSDTDRRIIRQSMNKLHGTHEEGLDIEEFKRILPEVGMEDLTGLIGVGEQEIMNLLNQIHKEEKEGTDKVSQLYAQEVTCPKCGHKFQKAK